MVDKTKRALTILQQRNSVNVNQINSAGNFGSGLTSGLASCGSGNFDDPLTRRTMEMMVEVRRRAEEAVSEVQNISLKLNFTLTMKVVGREPWSRGRGSSLKAVVRILVPYTGWTFSH